MNPIEEVLRRIQDSPDKPASKVFRDLLIALDLGQSFPLKQMYNLLDYKEFVLALDVMRAWRLEEMRVKQGALSDVVTQSATCAETWYQQRQRDFGLQGV